MSKLPGISFSVFLFTSSLFAAPKMLILNGQAEEGVAISQLEYLNSAIRIRLTRSGQFELIENVSAPENDSEEEQKPDCADAACAIQIGRSRGVNYALTGKLLQNASSRKLTIFLYKMETGELVFSDESSLPTIDSNDIDLAVRTLIDRLIARTTRTRVNPALTSGEEEKYNTLQRGLIYPGLGHFQLNDDFRGPIFMSLFTATLYNAAYRVPRSNKMRASDRKSDLGVMTVVALTFQSNFPGNEFAQNPYAGLLLIGGPYEARRQETRAANSRTRFSLFLMGAVYAGSVLDLAAFRLNLIAMPNIQDASYGMAVTYRF
ncbi:MAG: penicillin-binding protein activator LpoB [Spirochaetia bacterium]|nr:penicillin-binding protein activator LpoB [Spirochaetia bacterium]